MEIGLSYTGQGYGEQKEYFQHQIAYFPQCAAEWRFMRRWNVSCLKPVRQPKAIDIAGVFQTG